MSKKLLMNTNMDLIHNYNLTYSSWWLDESTLYKETYDVNHSIIVTIETDKQYYISSENADRKLYAFLDSDYNLIDSVYSGSLSNNKFTMIISNAPTNASYIIFYLESTNITNVTNFTISEAVLGSNLYNSNDTSMKTSWWIDENNTVVKLSDSINYSILVPIEEGKRYFLEYRNADESWYAFMDSEFNQISMSYEYLVYIYNKQTLTSISPSGTKYLLAYLVSDNIDNVKNIYVREFNTK